MRVKRGHTYRLVLYLKYSAFPEVPLDAIFQLWKAGRNQGRPQAEIDLLEDPVMQWQQRDLGAVSVRDS
jgi:hypothetical protein